MLIAVFCPAMRRVRVQLGDPSGSASHTASDSSGVSREPNLIKLHENKNKIDWKQYSWPLHLIKWACSKRKNVRGPRPYRRIQLWNFKRSNGFARRHQPQWTQSQPPPFRSVSKTFQTSCGFNFQFSGYWLRAVQITITRSHVRGLFSSVRTGSLILFRSNFLVWRK